MNSLLKNRERKTFSRTSVGKIMELFHSFQYQTDIGVLQKYYLKKWKKVMLIKD